jgi:hypothetical protein
MPNSQSGTTGTAKAPFLAADLCAILESCRQNGVAALTLGDLHVSFYAPPGLRRNERPAVPPGAEPPVGQAVVTADAGEVELTEEQKELLREADLAQLMADDPVAYEQAVIDENLRGEQHGEDAGRAE